MKTSAVKPSADWVQKNRAILLSQIKNTVPQKVSVPFTLRMEAVLSILMPETLVTGTVRFVAVFVIAALLAPSLYYSTAMASQEALPGDSLYGAKRYAEKIQIAVVGLVGDTKAETKLHVELAKRRATETSKIISDPSKISKVASTVADLKSEITTVGDKLEQNKQSMSADDAKQIKQNTDEIKQVLQEAKNELIVTSNTNDPTLNEVKETKDLVQDVSIKAVEVMVTKHLEGDTSVSKDEVKAAIDSAAQTAVGEVASSRETISDVQNVLKNVKSEVSILTASSTDPTTASTTLEVNSKISAAYDNANKAVQVTDTISFEAGRKAAEIQTLLGSDNLAQAVDRVKELNLASKDIETISDTAIQQTTTLMPIVEVVKEAATTGVTSTMEMVTSSVKLISSTPMFESQNLNTTSLKTLPLPPPSSTASSSRSASTTAPSNSTTSSVSNTSTKTN